ncbi:solute carrier family 35 member F6-like [Amphiura filiformis]|uniref:solute carrier family 35 member F6-like n=1 Tax=Amphiura filiformis TaxID=82378 RepID=UPI003B20EA3B
MDWTPYQFFLAALMLVTGSINTLSTKWADVGEAKGAPRWAEWDAHDTRAFYHPFFQSVCMFVGEMSCLLVFKLVFAYKRKRNQRMDIGPQRFSPLVMLPPAMCDMCGTSLMYIGLALTYASSFQMLRGAVIIFTGLLSVAFLGKKLKVYEWLGMFVVLAGLIIVGVTDLLEDKGGLPLNNILTGDLLIIMAQIITATQMVVEEKFLKQYDIPPLQAVGWEGVFGFSVLSILLVPFYFIPAGAFTPVQIPGYPLEDAIDAFYQMHFNKFILIATFGTLISIAFFNFAGISVTREMSATTRMVLDSLRTLTVWFVAVGVGWENFHPLLLLGFAFLLLGTFIYNDAVFAPFLRRSGI